MSKDETKGLIVLLAVFALGGLCGFFTGKAVYQPTYEEKVARDTVRVTDTVPHYYPRPVEKQVVRYVTRLMPVHSKDTVNRYVTMTDTMLVEVPIESRHYHGKEYDAWVSGYEPSLDSIKVYQRTEYITERVTISKPPNKWELDLIGGINYNFNKKKYTPYAGGELNYKPNRLQVGIRGGIIKNDKAEPFAGAVVRYRIF